MGQEATAEKVQWDEDSQHWRDVEEGQPLKYLCQMSVESGIVKVFSTPGGKVWTQSVHDKVWSDQHDLLSD